MPFDRSKIYQGMFLCSDQPAPGYTPRRDRQLRQQFPHFEAALDTIEPSPAERRLAALAASNRELEQRTAALKLKVAAFIARRKSS